MGECNAPTVTEKVKNQVGFEAILLDSKLYPLIVNDSTSGLDYWKSSRKIIATSRTVYEKIVGKSPAEELSQVDEEVVIVKPLVKKVRIALDDGDMLESIEKTVTNPILACSENAVSCVNQKLVFMDDLKKGFECIICPLPSV